MADLMPTDSDMHFALGLVVGGLIGVAFPRPQRRRGGRHRGDS